MKTKIKRHSRSVISVLLAVCMLVSCMTAGIIATDAAKEQGEEVGATYYIWKAESGGNTADTYTCLGTSPQTFSATTGKNYYIAVSTSATDISSGTVWLDGVTVSGVSTSATGTQGFDDNQGVYFAMASAATVKVSYSSGSKIKLETGTSTSSCTTDHRMIVTGSQQLTNTSNWQNTWSGAGTRNQMTYNSAIGMYEIKYTNIEASASASDYFRFRILDLTTKDPDTDWETNKGYAQGSGAITDASNILQGTSKTTAGSDNTFQFSLKQKANITIYLDDSKLSTNTAIQVIVTPAVSAVTPGDAKVGSTVTSEAGTIKVNNSTSTVENIAYGGSVTLTATAGDDYVFSQWEDNANLSYANKNAATTTATVTGSTTVNAIFVPKSYMLTRGTGEGYTITAPTTASSSKQWGTDVTITANAGELYYINYLYYKVNNAGDRVKIGEDAAANSETLTRTLSMPKNNVTVYAEVTQRPSIKITYGITEDSPADSGYINVGERHSSSTTQIERNIVSRSNVLSGTDVLFGARAAAGYKFLGWFANEDGSDSAVSTSGDYPVTANSADITLYAKFAQADIEAHKPAANKVRLMIRYTSTTNNTPKIYSWDPADKDNSAKHYNGDWDGQRLSAVTTGGVITASTTTYKPVGSSDPAYTYYQFDYQVDKLSIVLKDSGGQTANISGMTKGNVYVLDYQGGSTIVNDYWAPDYGVDTAIATTTYYPVKLDVTNPELGHSDNGSTGAYTDNYFVAAGSNAKIYARPANADDNKTRYQIVSGATNVDERKIYDADTATTHYSEGAMVADAEQAVATVTYVPKDYYKVNFLAGAGGTVVATAGGKTITSGTPVMEGTSVTITATPKSGYAVSGWTGDGTGTGTTRTISSLSGDATARVYFTASKGTANTGTYFGYGHDNNPYNWTFTTTYVRDGHVYAYIDTIGTNKTFYIGAYKVNPDNTEKKYKQMYYFNDTGKVWCSTEFSNYVTDLGRDENKKYFEEKCCEGKFTVSSDVKALIIDLGPDDGRGHAQTSKGDGNHKFVENNYRIIPVFNTDISKVSVYAKDASYRNHTDYDYLPGIANTVITEDSYVTGKKEHSEFETAVATKGQNITVTTTIGDSYKTNYYVKGFSVNGVTPALYEWNTDGIYTMTYKIPADFDKDYLEITPIYYRKNLSTVQFYIENYDEAFQSTGWGNTLSIYPYYQDTANKNNAFGGYPGQPVINYGGRRFIEIPTSYNSKTIQGITLSNDYFDIVHRDYCREVDDHLQTYDYDDFYKIYKETSDGKEVNGQTKVADQITFAFKHRTKTNNFSDNHNYQTYSNTGNSNVPAPYTSFAASEKDTKFKNGWEPLLDYHDRPIDLFGKQLSSANQTKEPLLVVSDDYAITYAGRYATTWTVYRKDGSNYIKIKEIAPSALIVATQARLGNGTYPAVTDATGYPTTTDHKLADYSDEYQTLKAYADTPVQITYESAIRNQDGYEKHWSMTGGSSSEVSKRSDGRWFYSYEGEIINADLRIEYKNPDDPDTAYVSDTFREGTNRGTVTGATVHFTNTANDAEGPYALTEFHDTADYDGDIVSNFNYYYKFAATDVSGYIFQGWYMERDGISTAVNPADIKNLAGKSQMTSNATFVARYIKNPAGHLTINHLKDDGSTGSGTTYIGIEKSTDGTTWTNITGTDSDIFVREDMVSVTDTDVMAYNSGYTLRVTLKTVVGADTAFDRFSANDDEHSPNYFSSEVTTDGSMSTTSFEVPVDDLFAIVDGFPKQQFDTLTYFSHTTKRPELIINHSIDPTSDSMAEGTAYVQAEVLNASGNHLAWLNGSSATDYVQGQNLTLPYNYFNTEGYKLKVYLKTTMGGFTQFDKFSILGEDLGNHQMTTGQSVQITDADSKRTQLAEITFPIADLFSNNGEPLVTELPYLSRLFVPEYKYVIKYTYPKYTDKTVSASYTVKELFSPEDLSTYMSLTNNDLAFQNDDAKKTFACSKAPYEDNFQKILDWSKGSFGERIYNASTFTLSLQVSIEEAEQQKLNVQFNLPYAAKNEANPYEPLVTDNKVTKTDPRVIVSTKNTYGRDWFVISGKRNNTVAQGDDPVFVEAPLIIYDGNTPYYFKYWTVQTEATANNASREYTRCYDYEFNLAIFQDCIITPEYDTTPFENRGVWPSPATYYNAYDSFYPNVNREYYKSEDEDNGVSITFLENSRNQYNNGDCGANEVESRNGAADRIYSDFLLTFDFDPTLKLNTLAAGQKQAGLIIQPVAYLEKNDKGEYVVKGDNYYASTSGYAGLSASDIKNRIETGNFNGLVKSQFDVHQDPNDLNSGLDNKNRMQYYYGLNNATPKTQSQADANGDINVGDLNKNHTIVYKAFAYIGNGDGTGNLTDVIVSQQPVYFTIYNDATIAPGRYMPNGN